MRNAGRGTSILLLASSFGLACSSEDDSQATTLATTVGSGPTTVADDGGSGDADGDGGTGESGVDPSADSSGGNDGESSDPTHDPTTEGGTCDFDMTAAIRLTVDVSWEAGIAVLEGGGAIDIWLLADLDANGGDVAVSGRVCRIALPDFQTGLLAGNETYGTMFPDAIWNSASMPTIDATASISSMDPGATLHLERGAVVLGGEMADPLNDAWPSDWHSLATADHDGDGAPGVTAVAKTGGNYAYPRIDILNSNARAQQLYLVSRTILEFDGMIDSCDDASGAATISMENHNVGCATVGGGSCSDGQTTTLDNNLPQFIIDGGSFELVRLSDAASCDDVFAALP
ncbi:MAG: hypothetical protein K1X88_17900 [Nannocystaceae bacterium]|nr:hypothetical protein [Nannocystaceae bacterium]